MANEKVVLGQFMAQRAKNPDSANDPFAPAGDVSVKKDFLEADVVKNLTPHLPPQPAGPGPLPKQPSPALSGPAELPEQPAPKPHPPAVLGPQPAPPLTPTKIAAQQPPTLPPLAAPPAPDPKSTPGPPNHVPAGPPPSSANPPNHVPDPGPASSGNPPPYVPPAGPASTANPPPFSPSQDIQPAPVNGPNAVLKEEKAPPLPKSAPPAEPRAVGPIPTVGGTKGQPVTDFISAKAKVDSNVQQIFKELDKNGKYASTTGFPVNTQGDLLLDPTLYAKQLARIGSLLGRTGLFAATQAGLFIMNRRGKIWNPLTLAPVPLTELEIPVMIDVPEKNEVVDHSKIFEAAIKEKDAKAPVTKEKLQKIFSPGGSVLGAVVNSVLGLIGGKTGDDFVNHSLTHVTPAFTKGVIPAKFNKDNDRGFLKLDKGKTEPPIDDDEAFVPMSFTDLRPMGNSYRVVYFRPFITSLSEDFNPEWNLQSYFGRVDPVATYQSTGRVVNLGFQLVTFTPQDVPTIYQKLTWLSSMVYPEYDKDLLFKSGPVVRMRVGNLIDGIGPGGRGLPGIITQLSYDYSDSTWELKKNLKVPRVVNVTLSFQVLHDRPIGRGEDGKFGGLGEFEADGTFKLPTGDSAFSAGGQTSKSPTLVKGHQSFRAIDDKYDPNDYK